MYVIHSLDGFFSYLNGILFIYLIFRKSFVAAKTCCSSTYDKIILPQQYTPSKKSAQRKSAINIRDRNASDSYANVRLLSENLKPYTFLERITSIPHDTVEHPILGKLTPTV